MTFALPFFPRAQLDIHVTDQYPFEPPRMRFTTKVWHPNGAQILVVSLPSLVSSLFPLAERE